MVNYHEVQHAIENSRNILPCYKGCKFPKLYGDTLIEKAANDLEDMIQAPRELIMVKLLSAVSIALQHLVDVEAPDGRVIPVSIYLLALARSGERKSAVEKKVYQPIYDFEAAQIKSFCESKREFSRAIELFEEKRNALKKKLRRSMQDGENVEEVEKQLYELLESEPTCPAEMKLIYTDVTSEALIDGMDLGSKYAAIASGEGGAALRNSALRDYPMLNSLWSGEPVRKQRKTSRSSYVDDGRLTLSLDIQPVVFEDFLKKSGEMMNASGFFARCFMASPSSRIGNRFHLGGNRVFQNYTEYTKKVKGYLKVLLDVISGEEPRRVVRLSINAQRRMVGISNAIEQELNPGGLFSGQEDYGAKHAEKILRLACLLSVFEYGYDTEINEGAINHALHLSMYFASQQREVFRHICQDEKEDQLLLSWIERQRQQGLRYVKKNDMRRRVPTELRNSQKLEVVLGRLEAHGQVARCMLGRTACVDLMPWQPVNYSAQLNIWPSGGPSGRFY